MKQTREDHNVDSVHWDLSCHNVVFLLYDKDCYIRFRHSYNKSPAIYINNY